MLARWAVLVGVVLVGCGRSRPSRPIVDVAAEGIAHHPLRDAGMLVDLARAQVAAGDAAKAKSTIAEALAQARASTTTTNTLLIAAIDVLVALGDEAGATELRDEAVQRIGAVDYRAAFLRDALAPEAEPESRLALDALAQLVVDAGVGSFDDLEVGSRLWEALVARADDFNLLALARRARRVGKLDVARQLVQRAVPAATTPDQRLAAAEAAALAGDAETAKALVAKPGPYEKPAEGFAQLALVHALVGDATASEVALKQALAAKPAASADSVWANLALARARRGDVEGARTMLAEHHSKDLVRSVIWGLVEQGQPELLDELFADPDKEQTETITYVVVRDLLDRGKLAEARARATDEKRGYQLSRSAVATAYARAGDLAAVRALAPRTKDDPHAGEGYVLRVAYGLAKQGRCDDAIALTRDFLERGPALAVLARFCPKSKD